MFIGKGSLVVVFLFIYELNDENSFCEYVCILIYNVIFLYLKILLNFIIICINLNVDIKIFFLIIEIMIEIGK